MTDRPHYVARIEHNTRLAEAWNYAPDGSIVTALGVVHTSETYEAECACGTRQRADTEDAVRACHRKHVEYATRSTLIGGAR
jgi:hypothetical protein